MKAFKKEYINTRENILETLVLRDDSFKDYAILLIKNPNLSLKILDKIEKNIDWTQITISPNFALLTEEIIERYKDKWCTISLSRNPNLTIKLVKKFWNFLEWNILVTNNSIDQLEIAKIIIEKRGGHIDDNIAYMKYIDDIYFCTHVLPNIPIPDEYIKNVPQIYFKHERFVRHFNLDIVKKYMDTQHIKDYYYINEYTSLDIIEYYKDIWSPIDWYTIFSVINPDYKFLKSCPAKLLDYECYWYNITLRCILDRDIIRDFGHMLRWDIIIKNCYFNQDMMQEYKGRYNEEHFFMNPHITLKDIQEKKLSFNDKTNLCQNYFLYTDGSFKYNIIRDIDKRRESIDIDITIDIKNFILKYYVGYD